MTKEEAIKCLQQFYPNGGHCWLDEQRIEAIGIAINALQGEPVSMWHNSGEMPQEKKVCLIRYSANDGASTNNFEVVIAEPLTRRFVTRSYPHKTGYQHTIHGENTIKVDEYQDRREYIPFSDIDEWAYIDDLLNLSNVERTVKNRKEPVSEELEEYINELSKQFPEVSFAKLSRIAVRVAKWQKEKEYTCYEEAFEDVQKALDFAEYQIRTKLREHE
jgi:hypothetical protein